MLYTKEINVQYEYVALFAYLLWKGIGFWHAELQEMSKRTARVNTLYNESCHTGSIHLFGYLTNTKRAPKDLLDAVLSSRLQSSNNVLKGGFALSSCPTMWALWIFRARNFSTSRVETVFITLFNLRLRQLMWRLLVGLCVSLDKDQVHFRTQAKKYSGITNRPLACRQFFIKTLAPSLEGGVSYLRIFLFQHLVTTKQVQQHKSLCE